MDGNMEQIGNYRPIEQISAGGFARVYRAKHAILTTRVVALKVLHAYHLSSDRERERFIQEAQLLESLRHRYVLPIIDVGIHNGIPYLVTEYAAGGSLRDLLDQTAPDLLDLQRAFTILGQ